MTDEVFSFLGPATRALALAGHSQSIIVVDDQNHRHNVHQLVPYATMIRVPKAVDPLGQWNAVFKSCKAEAERHQPDAIHFHGAIPYIIGSLAMRSAHLHAPTVYSPHGSRSLGILRLAGRLAILAASPVVKPFGNLAIVALQSEAHAFNRWKSAKLIENPVQDAYFVVERKESDHPLIVSGGRQVGMRSIEVISQLAVLLSGEELGIAFNWLGTAKPSAVKRLAAAEIQVIDQTSALFLAKELARGWIYVAPWRTRGFPVFLAQAMAVGLPCVALDCEHHRNLIEDGKNGFLCASDREMVHKIAMLIDDPVLRASMGAEARVVAANRFSEVEFAMQLLSAYPSTASVHEET